MANRASRHSMTKWHPRKSDGKAVRCEADVRKCPRTTALSPVPQSSTTMTVTPHSP